jgi:hydroxymethylglutaryl-CoA lyase
MSDDSPPARLPRVQQILDSAQIAKSRDRQITVSLRGRPITIVEVGPRDGLQNEQVAISTADKIAFVDLLSAAGLPVIEVSAFVSPKWVPRMADAEEVLAGISRQPQIRYTALVPNLAGLERAERAGLREVAVFAAASETFSRRNINQSIDGSLAIYKAVCDRAGLLGMRVRGYVSTAFGCPFEGDVAPDRVADVAARLIDLGVFEVAISDTIGIAHPGQVERVLDVVLTQVSVERIALHFHDTRGTALANVLTALSLGVSTFDASAGGLGGCPYAPGAAGNLATDDLVYMLNGLGADTGVSLEGVSAASTFIGARLDHPLPSRFAQSVQATTQRTQSDS